MGYPSPCPGPGYPLARTGVPPSQDGYPPGRDLGPVTGVPPRKYMGPVKVLWDGGGVPPPERTWDQWKYYGMTNVYNNGHFITD